MASAQKFGNNGQYSNAILTRLAFLKKEKKALDEKIKDAKKLGIPLEIETNQDSTAFSSPAQDTSATTVPTHVMLGGSNNTNNNTHINTNATKTRTFSA